MWGSRSATANDRCCSHVGSSAASSNPGFRVDLRDSVVDSYAAALRRLTTFRNITAHTARLRPTHSAIHHHDHQNDGRYDARNEQCHDHNVESPDISSACVTRIAVI